jgi:carbon storage regulator
MLVIRRSEGESLLLSGGVEIKVLEAGARKVILGIDAPPEVVVLRKEVAETGQANRSAALSARRLRAAELARLFRGKE